MAQTIRFQTYDSEDRAVRVEATYSPPTPDRGPDMKCAGGYHGDPEEISILSVTAVDLGADVAEVEADVEGLREAVRLLADDDSDFYDDPPYDTREEARGER